ncbi:MAG: hypothetical protein ACI9PY_002908 [Ascidiaceihabitans sp.]|jgi:hypothetical protein
MTRVLSDFIGRWTIARQISHVGAGTAVFSGHADWTPSHDGLNYLETGVLEIAGHPAMQSQQSYRWEADLNVYFADGRFFHKVPATGGMTQHWCDPDAYSVDYDFADWPNWSTRWQVQGPRKNYQMTTQYRPD